MGKKRIKVKIKKGDTVRVIAGDDKEKTGKVLQVLRGSDDVRVIVEGINIVSKHEKPAAGKPEGGIKKTEASIHISNLQLIDGSGSPTRVGRKLNDKGKLQRYSKKTGEYIS